MKNEYRNNYLSWVGVMVPWAVCLAYSFSVRHLFPEEHALELSGVAAVTAVFGLFTGGPAIYLPFGGWLGYLGAGIFGAVNLACAVCMLLSADHYGVATSRWPRIVGAEVIMLMTLWSFAFGWLAIRRGDRRYAATHPGPRPSAA